MFSVANFKSSYVNRPGGIRTATKRLWVFRLIYTTLRRATTRFVGKRGVPTHPRCFSGCNALPCAEFCVGSRSPSHQRCTISVAYVRADSHARPSSWGARKRASRATPQAQRPTCVGFSLHPQQGEGQADSSCPCSFRQRLRKDRRTLARSRATRGMGLLGRMETSLADQGMTLDLILHI